MPLGGIAGGPCSSGFPFPKLPEQPPTTWLHASQTASAASLRSRESTTIEPPENVYASIGGATDESGLITGAGTGTTLDTSHFALKNPPHMLWAKLEVSEPWFTYCISTGSFGLPSRAFAKAAGSSWRGPNCFSSSRFAFRNFAVSWFRPLISVVRAFSSAAWYGLPSRRIQFWRIRRQITQGFGSRDF